MFGPDAGTPPGGFCLSVFLFVRRAGGVLVGRMAESPRWETEWAPNLRLYDAPMRGAAFAALRFPATYLRVGEAPRDAALRIWRDQLGFTEPPDLSPVLVLSEAGPSRRHPGNDHWDVVFHYEAMPPNDFAKPPHWATLEMRPVSSLAKEDFAMSHGEMLSAL